MIKKFLKVFLSPLFNERGEVRIGEEEELEEKDKKNPPAGANQQLEEAQKRIKELEEKAASLETEKKGIYSDFKKERETRQKLEQQTLEEKERMLRRESGEDEFGEIGDDDFITGKHLKKLISGLNGRDKKRAIQEMENRANERVAVDEDRMSNLCEAKPDKYPIPYEEAIDAFKELAEKDPTLWAKYDRARFRPGGKPAELAYKIALREHPKFKDQSEKTVREKLLDELEEKGKRPPKLKAGGSGGKTRLEDMTDEEIANLTDDELERYSR